jgi:predicted O-methyltransferase YrrM
LNLNTPTSIRHALPSAILSADDDPGKPTKSMIDLALKAARCALDIDLSDLSQRLATPPLWPDIWPGEHYKLLAGLVQLLQPRSILEIGTATGLSALALKKYLPPNGRVVTFDIIPWVNYPGHVLAPGDFADGRMEQVVADLTNPAVALQHARLLKEADLLFVDAAKDGQMEAVLLNNLSSIGLKHGAWLVFDDIRMMNMIPIWRRVSLPKLDLTSFGHWSGTGLVSWSRSGSWCA